MHCGATILGKNKNFAFTLAEVLITLGIIGVVAAMTLPALINNNQNTQMQSGLKKAYSIIAQSLDMFQAENGFRYNKNTMPRSQLKESIYKYFKVIRDCGWGTQSDLNGVCIPNSDDETLRSSKYTTLNGKTNISLHEFDDGQFVISDGMLIIIEDAQERNLYISADVNGFNKKPNQLGRDLFMFQIAENGKLLPMGAKGTTYYSETDEYCSATSANNMNGAGCTEKALSDKDYFKKLPK